MRDKTENKIAKILHGRLTKASGAVNDDADIRIPGFLIESKRRDTVKSIVFYPKIWEKLRKQCVQTNRLPLYMFSSNGKTYCITYKDLLTSDIMKGKRIIKTRTSGRLKSNIHIDPEEYWNAHDLAYVAKAYPMLVFFYKNMAYGIIDLDTLRICLNGRMK